MWEHINKALGDGVRRVLFGVASFLPGLVILIAALLCASIVAWAVSRITRGMLRGIKFDKRMEEIGFSGLADWSPNKSPTLFVAKLVWWLIIAFGLLVGLAGFATELASKIVVQIIAYLPNIVVGLALLAIGNLLARFLARGALIGAVNLQIRSAQLISLVVKWLVLVVTAAMVLDHLHIGGDIVKLTFAILFGGVVLALALVVGLGWRDLVERIGAKPTKEHPEDESSTLHHL
jgi:flagellar biogenesis protein FliO